MSYGPNGKDAISYSSSLSQSFFSQFIDSEFDLISELIENRDRYKDGEIQLTVYKFPSSLYTSLDLTTVETVVQSHNSDSSKTVSKPGIGITALCCFAQGFKILQSNDEIKRLIQVKRDLQETINLSHRRGHIDSWLETLVCNQIQQFSLDIKDSALSFQRKVNLHIGKDLKNAAFSLMGELGMNFSSLAILSIMVTLQSQSFLHEERQSEMRARTAEFFRAIKTRADMFAVFDMMISLQERRIVITKEMLMEMLDRHIEGMES